MAVTEVSNLADRVQDYTVDALTQSLGVPLTRTITTTLPLTGGGALSSNLTLAVNTFGAATSGIVPLSGGGTDNFLRADGTWATGTISGVPANRTLTTTAPLKIDGAGSADLSADRTLTVVQFTSISPGVVPLSGGGTINYMRADGTWANPFGGGNSGPWVLLQTAHPGVTDTGSAHISGWLEADTVITNSSAASTRGGANLGAVQIEAKAAADGIAIEGYGTSFVPPTMTFRRGRGTLATPLQVVAADLLGQISIDATSQNTTAHSVGRAIAFYAESPQASEVPWNLRLKSGYSAESASYFHWMTQTGQVFGKNIATQPTPTSDNDFRGSFAISPTYLTAATHQVADTESVLICDATIQDIVITIPWNSSARGGRFLYVKRTDNVATHGVVINSFIGGMDLASQISIESNDAVVLYGDGAAAWRVISQERWRQTQATPNSALANSVVETAISDGMFQPTLSQKAIGTRVKIVAGGKFSTTGTPTLRLQVGTLLDSGAITTGSGVTNADWRVECEFVYEGGALGTVQVRYAGCYTYLQGTSGIQTRYVSRVNSGASADERANTLYVYATWGTASASNTITCEYAYCDVVPGGFSD